MSQYIGIGVACKGHGDIKERQKGWNEKGRIRDKEVAYW